jgi:hypothetical protein
MLVNAARRTVMPSPFPGMDPYLEDPGLWPDVHHNLISEMQARLNAALRPAYHVRIEERVYVSDETDSGREVITLIDDEIHEAFLKIVDRADRTVVTVIELLSPTNKHPAAVGLKKYREKRHEVMTSSSHFVGVDLLRQGVRIPVKEELPPCDYLVHISRVEERPRGRLWPLSLRDRLPVIPIPLRAGDEEASLDLQTVLNTAYDRAGYDLEIDYRAEPVPPLTPELAQWTDELLRQKGLR